MRRESLRKCDTLNRGDKSDLAMRCRYQRFRASARSAPRLSARFCELEYGVPRDDKPAVGVPSFSLNRGLTRSCTAGYCQGDRRRQPV